MPPLNALINALAPAVGNLASLLGNKPQAEALAAMIRQMGPQYEPKIEEAKGGSVYLTVDRHTLTAKGERSKAKRPTQMGFKARFADHGSYWGSTISLDPVTKNNVRQAFALFKHHVDPKAPPEVTEFNRSIIDPGTGLQYVAPVRFNENVWKNGGKDFWREAPRALADPVR